MMDTKERWIQLFVSLLVTVIYGSGGGYLLRLFEERLPSWLFTVFLILLIIAFIAILIRFVFEDWVNKLIRWVRTRQGRHARQKLVRDWHDKWLELHQLLVDISNADWQSTDQQKGNYSRLRSWFIKNRSELIPKWQSFVRNRTDTACEDEIHWGEYSLPFKISRELRSEDPFSYFYEPLTLGHLSNILKRYDDNEFVYALLKLTDLIKEFVEWVRVYR